MDVFFIRKMVDYRIIDQAHTNFMTVVLFREGGREHEEENGAPWNSFKYFISLKDTTLTLIKLNADYLGLIYIVLSDLHIGSIFF